MRVRHLSAVLIWWILQFCEMDARNAVMSPYELSGQDHSNCGPHEKKTYKWYETSDTDVWRWAAAIDVIRVVHLAWEDMGQERGRGMVGSAAKEKWQLRYHMDSELWRDAFMCSSFAFFLSCNPSQLDEIDSVAGSWHSGATACSRNTSTTNFAGSIAPPDYRLPGICPFT